MSTAVGIGMVPPSQTHDGRDTACDTSHFSGAPSCMCVNMCLKQTLAMAALQPHCRCQKTGESVKECDDDLPRGACCSSKKNVCEGMFSRKSFDCSSGWDPACCPGSSSGKSTPSSSGGGGITFTTPSSGVTVNGPLGSVGVRGPRGGITVDGPLGSVGVGGSRDGGGGAGFSANGPLGGITVG